MIKLHWISISIYSLMTLISYPKDLVDRNYNKISSLIPNNFSNYFMSGNEGINCIAPIILKHTQIAVTESAIVDFYIYLIPAQISQFIFKGT